MNFDIRVPFIILQADIKAGLVLFDQVHFQDQGFQLGSDDDPFNIRDSGNQLAGAGVLLGAGMKIGSNPTPQIDRFSDVNNLALPVFHQVAACFAGDGIEHILQVLVDFHSRKIVTQQDKAHYLGCHPELVAFRVFYYTWFMFSDQHTPEQQEGFSRSWTVSEVNSYLRSLLESDSELQDLWVEGEISNLARPRSGHLYFTLKDSGGSLRCVMWKNRAAALAFELKEGGAVEAHGSVSIYEQRGEYQLYVDFLRPRGEGRLYQEYLRLKAQLEQEGLFDSGHKQPLADWPELIGLVTSASGAALQDMLNTFRRRYPLVQIQLFPTAVQGKAAPPQITRALEKAAGQNPDLIIIARGGGSIEDLWAFNDEQVARAIFHCPVPVISGVGHETDFTIADFVADVRAPTPTAAAELAVPDQTDLRGQLDEFNSRQIRAVQTRINEAKRLSQDLSQRVKMYSPANIILNGRQRVDELTGRLILDLERELKTQRDACRSYQARLENLNPEAILKRGYAVVSRGDGTTVYQVEQVEGGEPLLVQVSDGSFKVTVQD